MSMDPQKKLKRAEAREESAKAKYERLSSDESMRPSVERKKSKLYSKFEKFKNRADQLREFAEPSTPAGKDQEVFFESKREARQWKRGKDNMPKKGAKDGPAVSLEPEKFVSNEYWSKRKARQWKREGKKEIRAAAMAEKARQRMNAMNYRA